MPNTQEQWFKETHQQIQRLNQKTQLLAQKQPWRIPIYSCFAICILSLLITLFQRIFQ